LPSVITCSISAAAEFSDSKLIGQILHEVESKQNELHIEGFGVSMTTLEDVFIKASVSGGNIIDDRVDGFSKDSRSPSPVLKSVNEDISPSTKMQQFKTMCWYNWLYARNNLKTIILLTLLPCL